MSNIISLKTSSLKEKRAIEKMLKKHHLVSYEVIRTKKYYKFEILTPTKESGSITEDLKKLGFGRSFERGIIIHQVEASIPSLRKKEYTPTISDEEIKEDIKNKATTNWIYLSFVSLAALIIALGLLGDNFIVVIGGMLIAPLLYPIIGNSYFLLTGYRTSLKQTFSAEMWGLSAAIVFGIIIAVIVPAQLAYNDLVLSKSVITVFDIGVAIFAGAAGALSVSTRQLGGFSGVALAVALMPPAVTVGIGLGIADITIASGAFLLTIVNVIAVHMASIIIFTVLGYAPKRVAQEQKNNNKKNKKNKKK